MKTFIMIDFLVSGTTDADKFHLQKGANILKNQVTTLTSRLKSACNHLEGLIEWPSSVSTLDDYNGALYTLTACLNIAIGRRIAKHLDDLRPDLDIESLIRGRLGLPSETATGCQCNDKYMVKLLGLCAVQPDGSHKVGGSVGVCPHSPQGCTDFTWSKVVDNATRNFNIQVEYTFLNDMINPL